MSEDLKARAMDAIASLAPLTKHSQTCPVWAGRGSHTPVSQCSCWIRENAERDITTVLGVFQPELDRLREEVDADDRNISRLNTTVTTLQRRAIGWRVRAEDAEAALERVREEHRCDNSNPYGPWCDVCQSSWPCRTYRSVQPLAEDTPESIRAAAAGELLKEDE